MIVGAGVVMGKVGRVIMNAGGVEFFNELSAFWCDGSDWDRGADTGISRAKVVIIGSLLGSGTKGSIIKVRGGGGGSLVGSWGKSKII